MGRVVSNSVSCIWDQIVVVESGVTNSTQYVGEDVVVWFRAEYAYDHILFDGDSGVLLSDDSELEWSNENQRWEYRHTKENVGDYLYEVGEIVDSRFDISSLQSGDSVRVTWIEMIPDEPEIVVEETYSDVSSNLMMGFAVILISALGYMVYRKR